MPRLVVGFWRPHEGIADDDSRICGSRPDEDLVLLESDVVELEVNESFYFVLEDKRVNALMEYLHGSSRTKGSVSTTALTEPDRFDCIVELYHNSGFAPLGELASGIERCRRLGGMVQVTFE
ncbi:MAG: hypothetical protein QF415_12730 [Candidatus Undinarchaeales archaeon]|jgi:hypothetical protein|nr:hypothetical protein [Candidatus Undinarchaeales archaeon]MDP7493902.1 hypothetical protein [Candidatus Undinarchaeales archaeon]